MWDQDWTIVEPPAANYSSDLVSGAQTFSDVALVVISRPGGENSNLPADMELGFVEEHPQIKNVLWCPAPGQIGFNALWARSSTAP